jgi:hypothetical protein
MELAECKNQLSTVLNKDDAVLASSPNVYAILSWGRIAK